MNVVAYSQVMRRRLHILTFLFLYFARLAECIRVETNTNLQPFHHHFSVNQRQQQPPIPQQQPTTVIYRPFAYPISVLDGEAYLVNGRFVKQYAVMEHIPNDVAYPNDLFAPFFVDGFNHIDGTSSNYLDDGIFHQYQDGITLGSGSLGYIQLDNGEIFLGSGSLGFISTKERNYQIRQARMRKNPPPGPFSFGSAPSQLS